MVNGVKPSWQLDIQLHLISNISTAYNSGYILILFSLGQQFVYQKRARIPLGKDCY